MKRVLCYSIQSCFIAVVSTISAKVSFYRHNKWQKTIVVPYLDAIMIVDFPKSMRLKTIQVSLGINHTYKEVNQGLDQKD